MEEKGGGVPWSTNTRQVGSELKVSTVAARSLSRMHGLMATQEFGPNADDSAATTTPIAGADWVNTAAFDG